MGLGEKGKVGGVRCHVEREKEGEDDGYAPGQVNGHNCPFFSMLFISPRPPFSRIGGQGKGASLPSQQRRQNQS